MRGRVEDNEFAVLLANCGRAAVAPVLERIRAGLSPLWQAAGAAPVSAFRAVVLEYDPQHHEDVKMMIDEAARKLHQQRHPPVRRKKPAGRTLY